MTWDDMQVEIVWERCLRRQWPAAPELAFSILERRKRSQVLLYWWTGRGERVTPAGVLPVGPGVCHWSKPGFDYSCRQEPGQPLGVMAIHFNLRRGDGAILTQNDLALPGEALRVERPALVAGVLETVAGLAGRMRRGGVAPRPSEVAAATALFRGLLQWLAAENHESAPATGGLAGAPAYIREHLAGVGDTGRLAQQFGMSRGHFTRRFHELTGLSPHEYLIRERLECAKELLQHTDLKICEIAGAAGYSTSHRFCRQFRERIGTSPEAWRRQQ